MKNIEIEIERFFAIIFITILHFSEEFTNRQYRGFVPGGYLGVDFFFIISGYFLAVHFFKNQKTDSPFDSSIRYTAHRLKRIYPPYLLMIVVYNLVTMLHANSLTFTNILKHIWNTKWQFLLLHFVGAKTSFDTRSIWFISVLIVLSFLYYFLISYNSKLLVGILPLFIITIYSYIATTFGTLSMQSQTIGYFGGGIVRGFVAIGLGIVIYSFTKLDLCKNFNIVFANIVKLICIFVILYIMGYKGFDSNDFFAIPLFAILIFMNFTYPIKMPKFLTTIFVPLGNISYEIFLNHLTVAFIITTYFSHLSYTAGLILFLLLTIIFSTIMHLIIVKLPWRRFLDKLIYKTNYQK